MQPESTLIYGEIVAIGRVANDERFEFRQFSSHLKVQLVQENGKVNPLMLDCIQWLPSKMNLTVFKPNGRFFTSGIIGLH